jgi:hypothetical protein
MSLATSFLCRPTHCFGWWVLFLASYEGLLVHPACAQAPSAPHTTAAVSASLPARLQPYYVGTLGAKHPIHLSFFLTKDLLEAPYYYHPEAGEIPLVGVRDRVGTITLEEYDVHEPSILVATFVLTPSPDGSLRGTWQPWAAHSGATRPLAVVLRPEPGPTLATCPPARLRQRPHQLLPTILTGDKLRDAQLQTQLEAEAALLAGGDRQSCTVSYFGHGLLSLSFVSEIAGANVSGCNRVCVVDVCAAAPVDVAQELDPRRRAAFEREANRRLQQLLEAYYPRIGRRGRRGD